MSEKELQLLVNAAQLARLNPSELKPINPFSQQGGKATSMQVAVAELDPAQAARWRVEAGESISLESAAAKAGLTPMSRAAHNELSAIDADYITGQEEAKGRREADLLASLEKGADQLREAREKQQQTFSRSAGNNTSGGAFTREWTQRWGNRQQQQNTPARRVLGK